MSEQHETYPNLVEAIILVVILMLVEMIVAAGLRAGDFLTDVDWLGTAGVITVVGNGVLFVGLMAYKHIGYRDLFHPTRNSVAATLALVTVPILLLVPGLLMVASAINAIVIFLFPMSPDEQELLQDMVSGGALGILFGCIAAPVLEEMLFRGVILRSFLKQYSRTKAILLSSVIFAVAHMNLYQFATALAIGILSGWLYERCRSLWPCILLHASYNSFVTWFAQEVSDSAALEDSSAYVGAAFLAAIAGGLTLLRLLHGAKRTAGDRIDTNRE